MTQPEVKTVKSLISLKPSIWRHPILWWRLRKLRAAVKQPASPLERLLIERMDEAILFGEGERPVS